MAKYSIEDTTLLNIANAIREKTGEAANLTPLEMPEAILGISGGGSNSGLYAWRKYSNWENKTSIPEKTNLLLHFNDSLVDEKGLNSNITSIETPSYNTGKFNKSLVFDGAQYVEIPYSSNIVLGSDDFTIAGWYKWNNEGYRSTIFCHQYEYNTTYVWAGFNVDILKSGRIVWRIATAYNTYIVQETVDVYVTANEWTHFALTRAGETCYLFLNGVLVATAAIGTASMYQNSNGSFRIGASHNITSANGPSNYFVGEADEFILIKGTALWTADFTPPSLEYGESNGTFEEYVVSDNENAYPNNDYANDGFYYMKGFTEDTNTPMFTRIAYLESTGTQYIDTNYIPNNTTRVEISFEFTETPTSHAWILGARRGYLNDEFSIAWHTGANEFYDAFDTNLQYMLSCQTNVLYEIDKNRNTTTINGTSKTNTTSTFECNYSMFLFALHYSGGAYSPASLKIYSTKFYDNDVLVRDYVPVLDENNVACFYDRVTKTYFYNQGTGSFNAGPVM